MVLVPFLVAACGGGGQIASGPANSDGVSQHYSGILAATEFLVGRNRFPFRLSNMDGAELEDATVQVQFFSLNQEEPVLKGEETAVWRQITRVTPHTHADGSTHGHHEVRGVYVVDEVVLEESGIWRAQFTVTAVGGSKPQVEGLAFQVVETSVVPWLGDRVPATQNLTIHDVASFSEVSTRQVEDHLHDISVAGALAEEKPFVVVFSSPMFCVSRMCGPVTDMVAGVQERHTGNFHFIHIEPWDMDAARNDGRLVPASEMLEWRLPTEPWLFVVDSQGRVSARFEGLVTAEELERKLQPQ